MNKEEVKLFIFADDMILYLETPEKSMINLSYTIKEFSEVVGYKLTYKNQ